jgi:crotonobetainyl-CoA:carnitine CoA-transferase CaiB-like acyl-CoA transferase
MGDTGNADGRTFNSSGAAQYSVPAETLKTLQEEILSNPLVAPDLPPEIAEAAAQIKFTGSDSPSLPVNWRLAEAVASLKGLEAAVVNVLLHRKYGLPFQPVTINTDHATLFVMSTVLWTVDPGQGGLNITASNLRAVKGLDQFFPSYDKHGVGSSLYRALATNIYRTADGRYYHFHNSLDSKPTQDCLGLPHDIDVSSYDEAAKPYVEAVSQLRSEDLDHKYAEEYRQAGTICYSTEEYLNSEQGKANAHVGLWEIRDRTTAAQPPSWWPDSPQTGPNRPLAGLKVVDLTRIIAAPTVTRNLAELGASIMRCTSPNLPDVSSLHVDLNWGKWNSSIDLHSEEDRAKLKALILEADVVVQSYRPGVLDKYGFGQEDILKMCEDRPQGIIYARLNCFGWNGPWQERSGWQQIGDAVSFSSLAM